MKRFSIALVCLILAVQYSNSQEEKEKPDNTYPKALVNYDTFKSLVDKVETHRAKRLLSFNDFLKLSKDEDVIILDARSRYFYNRRHIKGAINLPFAEFTQESLDRLIPNKNSKILIYCNNNFMDDQINFASKTVAPKLPREKTITLALNIPTYINLYGYGYKNVYELHELISVFDKRIAFEGTDTLEY